LRHDLLRQRQPQPGTALLGREKRVEYARAVLDRDAGAGVAHAHDRCAFLEPRRHA
jgi:hypothetical protein